MTTKEKGSDARLPEGWQRRVKDMLDAERRRLDAEQARVEAIRLGKRGRSGG